MIPLSIFKEGIKHPDKTSRMLLYYFFLNRSKGKKIEQEKIHANNCELFLVPEDKGISLELLTFKTHEPLQTEIISSILKQGMCCLDIGSNLGYYAAIESRHVGNKGKIFAIEPSPINFSILKKNAKLQNSANIYPYNFACGDRNDIIKFAVSDRSNWSRVMEGEMAKAIEDDKTKLIDLPLKTIDTFVSQEKIERIDLIRMDIEGYEIKAYSGMSETIKKFKPMLAIEIHKMFLGDTNTKEFLLNLKQDGYEISYFIPREYDLPFIAKMKYVTKKSINQLIKQIDEGKCKDVFTLILTNKTK